MGGLGEGGGVDVEDGALVCSGGVDILEKVADDFNFNDSMSKYLNNNEIENEEFNFQLANFGNLIGKRHDINNPILSTNDEFLIPPEFEPLNKVQSLKGVNQFDFNRDSMVNSTLLNIPLIPNIIEPVFPPSLPIENSVAFNICFECSESLGNKGMTCPQCKESYHIKCHVQPKYIPITPYYQKLGLKNWKCSICKPPKSK